MMHIDLAVLAFTQDKREPLSVEDWIPFLSPVIAMGSKGAKFHKRMRLAIYTLRLPGSRLYIVNDTSLIPVLQRQVRTLSISPIMVRIFSHFMGVSRPALDIMGRDPVEDHGFVHEITLETVKGLAPGLNLDDLNSKAVSILNASLEHAPSRVKIFQWASHEIMMATTSAVYGPQNPFNDPAVRAAYYKLEGGLLTLVTGFLPSLLAKEALKARRVITEAFLKYYAENGLGNGASVYARNRYHYPISLGVPVEDVARMEAGGSLGLISNTMPATFWTLYHIFSDPVVLKDCREEVKRPSARERGGSTVLIRSTVQHSSPTAWSQDVDEFHHDRFIKQANKAKNNPVAFRAFGGGATLCPGRHFASTEILAFASIILLRFDIKPVTGSWSTEFYKETNAAFRVPNCEIDVQLIPRDTRKWHMFFSEPGKPMEISTEDTSLAFKEA
ncbi:cytochrome P450 [Apiospora hydei]|uniref:Cytochrome P450 n=1 Tax=Apiospora hydei TaxID=1337664 RepID=A0ABR1UUU9_9PEZI